MKLRPLEINEDRQNELFHSQECQQLLEIYEGYYPKFGYNPPWIAYLIVEGDQVLGTCSFTGKPKDGKVEIAYWTFEQFEGQGVASFACKKLIEIAKRENDEVTITAKTAPEKNASTHILERNGFVYSCVVQDEEIGDAWFWVLKAQNPDS